jgi:hypothetical protein
MPNKVSELLDMTSWYLKVKTLQVHHRTVSLTASEGKKCDVGPVENVVFWKSTWDDQLQLSTAEA